MGLAVARRAGGRADGSVVASRWPTPGRQRCGRRDARGHADRPELEFEDERVVAIAGAEFDVIARRQLRRRGRAPFVVRRSAAARSARAARGARAYLASRAASMCRRVLGSRATHLASRMGGLEAGAEGRRRLPLGDASRREPGAIRRRRPAWRAARAPSAGTARQHSRAGRAAARPLRRRRARRAAVGAVPDLAPTRIGWDSGSRARALRSRARRRHHLRRDAARRAAGARRRASRFC